MPILNQSRHPMLFFAIVGIVSMFIAMPIAPIQAAEPGTFAAYDQSLFLDTEWYKENMLTAADLWNGGLDGKSGMGTYLPDFDGFFHVSLDRQWQQTPLMFSTSVAQSRAIYMNVEAYRTAGPEGGERFLDAVNQGADFLLANFRDPQYGGFFWAVQANGIPADSMKQGYGNVHPILALAQAYGVTHDVAYLDAALEQLDVFQKYFLDPNYACAIHPSFSQDFSEIIGVNNIDVFTHFFESLLALHDVTDGAQQDAIDDQIVQCGSFLVNSLYHDQDGFTDRGYVAYNYDENWQPSQMPYTRETQWSGARQATTGHNIELAYLLSRAVERGFDSEWLKTADKLIKFCLEYAIDPEYGGMIYEITDYDGKPLEGNPDNSLFIWWAQAETARALLHFLIVRNVDAYRAPFKKVEALFHGHLTDPEYGGLYHALDTTHDLQPVGVEKADIWKTNYHYNMFFTEVLRLQATYPERIAQLNEAEPAG